MSNLKSFYLLFQPIFVLFDPQERKRETDLQFYRILRVERVDVRGQVLMIILT